MYLFSLRLLNQIASNVFLIERAIAKNSITRKVILRTQHDFSGNENCMLSK